MSWTRILALMIVTVVIGACSEKKSVPAPKASPPIAAIDIAVSGMHCDGCAMVITDALKQTDGVIECQVSLKDKMASVKYDPSRVTPAQLAAVIEKTGYKPSLPGPPLNEGKR